MMTGRATGRVWHSRTVRPRRRRWRGGPRRRHRRPRGRPRARRGGRERRGGARRRRRARDPRLPQRGARRRAARPGGSARAPRGDGPGGRGGALPARPARRRDARARAGGGALQAMSRTRVRTRVVCVVGPTASGKTALGLELAEALGGEIVSADSRQVYRRLEIGTAKPSAAERARVRYHCLDLVDPEEAFDAARYRAAAAAAIADVERRRRVPVLVGGTGLYVRALLGGLCPAPPRVPVLREALARIARAEGAPALHRRLGMLD